MISTAKRHNHLILFAALAMTACATTETIVERPTVTLVGVELEEVAFRSQTFLLEFTVSNPNAFPLPIESVRYQILFDKKRLAGGSTPASFSVPARGEGAFALSVDTDFLGSAGQITSILSGGVPEYVDFEIQGSLAIDLPLVKPLAFSSSGVIPIRNGSY
jgi:LEA14-like dessication related protein